MNCSSLPTYPAFDKRSAVASRPIAVQGGRFQATRTLLYLVIALSIWGLVLHMRYLVIGIENQPPADAVPPQSPFDFELIEQKYREVHRWASPVEVERLLGPPTKRMVLDPELRRWEDFVEHWNRHLGLPEGRYWDKWIDQTNQEKWVAVFYAGGKVYHTLKQGFE